MHGLAWAHVSDDELCAAMPAGPPMAKRKSAYPAALALEDLLLLAVGHCLRDPPLDPRCPAPHSRSAL